MSLSAHWLVEPWPGLKPAMTRPIRWALMGRDPNTAERGKGILQSLVTSIGRGGRLGPLGFGRLC